MAGPFSPKRQCANFERGFEFSRLHEEWMAAVYALVVPGPQGSKRESVPGVDCERSNLVLQGQPHTTERRAG